MSVRPLEGIRVVDFTWVRAGPWGTRWLSLLGAEVIKVEWPDPKLGGSNGRGFVRVPGRAGGGGTTPDGIEASMNSSGGFNDANPMKKSITLNNRSERGIEILKQLLAVSDVVIENFSAGVLESWGVGYEEMKKIKPDIIYVSMAGFGHQGPRAQYLTMGPSVQALSGLTHLSGLPGKQPAGWGWSYMDDTGGMYGAISVLTAIQHRDSTGEGQWADMSQVAAAMTLTGPAMLDWTVNGRGSRREGFPPGNHSVAPGYPVMDNYRGPICAPHNAYRTKPMGYNDWAGIVCESDEEWQKLVAVMGSPAWATDAKFATLAGRLEHQAEMDAKIEEWTEGFDKYELTDLCQNAGVRALPVQSSEDRVEHDPQLKARGHYDPAPHPILGSWPIQQAPWKLSKTPTPVAKGGPLAGEHNIEIFCGLLGISKEELRKGYEDNTFWPQQVPLESYLLENLDTEEVKPGRPAWIHTPPAKPDGTRGPLAGVRVIELADRSGQWVGKLMADFGADVVKVEPPGGVAERRVGPFYRDVEDPNGSLYFWHYNTSKKSVTIDLGTAEGREQFKQLASTADVLLETTKPGTLEAMGLGYDDLSKANPGLVMTSITPFGQYGPWKDYLTSDMLHLAAGGQMAGCGYDDPADDPDERPIAGGGGQAWHMGGHFAYMATLGALHHKNMTGEGQHVDASIHEACALTTEGHITQWIYGKQVVKRRTGRHAAVEKSAPTQVQTGDGRYLQLTNNAVQNRFKQIASWMDSKGMAEDLTDPKYLEAANFAANRPHISEVLGKFLKTMSAQEAMIGGQEIAGAPWGAIVAPEDITDDEHSRARGFFVEVEHPELGASFTYPGAAAMWSASPWRISRRPPLLGEDNATVLGALGAAATR